MRILFLIFCYFKKKLYLCNVKKSRHIIARTAAMVLLLLFATYYVQVNFFVHSHIVNGVTVVHSHMHRSTHHDTDTGGHSETELTIISSIFPENSGEQTQEYLSAIQQSMHWAIFTRAL